MAGIALAALMISLILAVPRRGDGWIVSTRAANRPARLAVVEAVKAGRGAKCCLATTPQRFSRSETCPHMPFVLFHLRASDAMSFGGSTWSMWILEWQWRAGRVCCGFTIADTTMLEKR